MKTYHQNKKTITLKTVLKNGLLFFVTLSLTLPQALLAQSMSSSNYVIQTDIINMAGGQSSSASYESGSKVGKLELDFVVTGVPDDDGSDDDGVTAAAGGGGIISQTILDEIPQNITNFTATALSDSIRLDWQNPSSLNFDRVVIVRSESFFPTSPNEGTLIYEGQGVTYLDQAVVSGVRYFYTAFSFYKNNDQSSGAVAVALILKPGQVPPVPGIDLPLIPSADPIIGELSLLDFDFIQPDRQVSFEGGLVMIDGGLPLLISLDYDKVPEVLKTIAVTLFDPEDRTKSFSFLLRANEDKSAYQAHIGALGQSGTYDLEITILDYENRGLKRINGALIASVSSAISDLLPNLGSESGLILWLIILLIIIYLLYRFYCQQKETRHRQREKVTFSNNYHA